MHDISDIEDPVVSIQGVKGSFHHIAAEYLFKGASYLERGSFDAVFNDCATERADYALVAIENSIAGSLLQNYDLLGQHNIPIIGEALLRIEHHLIAYPGVTLEEIDEIWSHPMAINQTHEFLDTLEATVIEKKDTAESVQIIRDRKLKHVAAIASEKAAEVYGMQILKRNIETDPNNYTRFLVLSKHHTLKNGQSLPFKTSLHFSLVEQPGSLAAFLQIIAEAGVNMTMIESRPQIGKPWQYDFFIDLNINANLEENAALLNKLKEQALFLQNLGSYPCFGYLKD